MTTANFSRTSSRVLVALSLFIGGCGTFSGSGVIPVSDADIQAIHTAAPSISSVPYMPLSQGRPVRIYRVAFDGTENDKNHLSSDERQTIVGHIADLTGALYYEGPGTGRPPFSWIDSAFGVSMLPRAERAHLEFAKQARRWLTEDPHVEIRVFVTGFSRGAATARQFMHLVEDSWRSDIIGVGQEDSALPPRFYAMLFDTVDTGQHGSLRASLPRSADYLIHYIAFDEARTLLFSPIVDVDSNGASPSTFMRKILRQSTRINTVILPGAHSDIGASYLEGIGDAYIVYVEQVLYLLGLIERNCWTLDLRSIEAGKHDSRGLLDKMLGSPIANSKDGWKRPPISTYSDPVSEEELQAIYERLDTLQSVSRRIEMQTRKTENPVFSVVRKGDGLASIRPLSGLIDPETVKLRHEGSQRFLAYRIAAVGSIESHLLIPAATWEALPENKETTLAVSRLKHKSTDVFAYFVGNKFTATEDITSETSRTVSSHDTFCVRDSKGEDVSSPK